MISLNFESFKARFSTSGEYPGLQAIHNGFGR